MKSTAKGVDDDRAVATAAPAVRFGTFLKKEREAHQLSQRELAKRIGRTSATVIGNLEENINMPNIETLTQLGIVFKWDFNRVMGFFGAPPIRGADRIGSEVAARPALHRLFAFARALDNARVDLLASTAEAWTMKPAKS